MTLQIERVTRIRSPAMTRFSYHERDYAFGQTFLTLRTAIGLTQGGLAEYLGVSRQAIGDWEVGTNYPKAQHLKAFIALAVQHQAFHVGHEAEEIRAFWKAARQKVLLDESWLNELVRGDMPRTPVEVAPAAAPASAPSSGGPRVDWGDALLVPNFYGRERELATLTQWIVDERCRVVNVLGMGGIGKSALVIHAMHQLAAHFQVVIFRSLRNSPPCESLLDEISQIIRPQASGPVLTDLGGRVRHVLNLLREKRVLLVLDNAETLLEEGDARGRLRPGFEGYARLLRELAETGHQSCSVLTSRERGADLRVLEGRGISVRSLRLEGLDASACVQLFDATGVVGSPHEQARLAERYGGNPLALKIVAETVLDLFGGAIEPFIAQDTLAFGSIADVIQEQIGRLSTLELTALRWLAIAREPITLEELRPMWLMPPPPAQLLEAIDGLRRRSLVERGHQAGTFTLHPVLLEYVTTRLVVEAAEEIQQGQLARLIEHRFCQAQTHEYVRQTQERLLVRPILARLQGTSQGQLDVQTRLCALLDPLRGSAEDAQGYGPANLVTLLRVLRGHLRGLDLSNLYLRDATLQGVEMQDTQLARATLHDPVITEAFDAIWVVTVSRQGTYWAAGDWRGAIRVWRENGRILHLAWRAHASTISDLVFSPDERTLASASWNGNISMWEVDSGALLWRSASVDDVGRLAFAPDGRTLASGSTDAIVRLWDAHSGVNFQRLAGHRGPVYVLAWHPEGSLLASGEFDGQIRLWDMPGDSQQGPSTTERVFTGHTNLVTGLAFAHDGRTLASASWDHSIKLWDVAGAVQRAHFATHFQCSHLAWSPDGRFLASGAYDQTIWLRDMEQEGDWIPFRGHTAGVHEVAFTPDSRHLLSGGDDRTLRVWDVDRGQCVRVIQAYAVSYMDIAWSPDGTQLASASSDGLVTLWNPAESAPPRLLRGHIKTARGVAWSPDGRWLASSGQENAVLLWDVTAESAVHTFRDPDQADTVFYGVAWSPDGQRLATDTLQRGIGVWDMTARTVQWFRRADRPTRVISHVAWSPDSTRLASCGEEGSVLVWDGLVGKLLARLPGFKGRVVAVAWSPDGGKLAGGSGNEEGGQIVVWDTRDGQPLHAWNALSPLVLGLAWSTTGDMLVSAGSDGMLRWWDVQREEGGRAQQAHEDAIHALSVSPDGRLLASCGDDGAICIWDLATGAHQRTLRRDRPYERLDITGIQGLTETQKETMRLLGAIEAT
jgi:WD40 repeat protein/transcriptional regulator with XRE-family HTH domain